MHHLDDLLFQTIFDHLKEPRLVLRPEGEDFRIITINKAYENAVDIKREALSGKSLWEVFDRTIAGGNTPQIFKRGLAAVAAGQAAVELPVFRFDIKSAGQRQEKWWRVDIEPILNGELLEYLICTTRSVPAPVKKDVTATADDFAKRMEKRLSELSESELRLHRIVMSTPVGLTIFKGRDMIINTANQPVLTIWGRTLEQVLDKPLMEVFPELADQPFPEMLRSVFETGKPIAMPEIPVTVVTPEGLKKDLYVDFSYDPLFDKNNEVEAILVSVKDITPLVEGRNALQEAQQDLEAINEELRAGNEELAATNEELAATNEELAATNEELFEANERIIQLNQRLTQREWGFRNLVEQAPVAMLVFRGEDMVIETANAAMLRVLNKGTEIIGKPLIQAMPELRGQEAVDQLFEVYHKGKTIVGVDRPVTIKHDGKDEERFFSFTYAPLIENDEVTGVIDMAVEVTEEVYARMQQDAVIAEKTAMEKTLRSSEQRLQGILDTMAEGVGITDSTGQMIYANRMAQNILGLTESEIKDRTYGDQRWNNLRVDGTPLPDDEHPMAIMMRTRSPLYDQEIAVQPHNAERKYISINAAPIIDEEGNLTGGIGTFMDVTHRRKIMQQKDDFIGIASHELKTPVTSLKAALQLLVKGRDRLPAETNAKLIDQAMKSLDRLNNLISDLLNTNRISQGQLLLHKTTFSLTNMVNDCCQHIRHTGSHDVSINGETGINIHADEQQIEQVLVNFVNNAMKYAPDSQKIEVTISKADNMVKIAVRDFGPGIPAEKLPMLFERYYRADYEGAKFSGLGLGLYISAEIIRKHGGTIGAESEFGKGSTFWFTLPVES